VRAREGITPVELVAREGLLDLPPRAIFAHALFASRGDLARLDPTRHAIAYCPSSQLEFGFPADIATLSSANVSWVLGTDCAASNDSMNLQKELRLAHGAASATITGSASYERFLASGRFEDAEATQQRRTERSRAFAPHATSNALLSRVWERAGTLHPGVRVGTIAVGALANILAWNTDHPAFWPEHDLTRGLAMGDTTGALHAMFVAGRRIGRIGDVTRNVMESDDYREARIEATERFTRLLAG
jgi:cytosine/adenosine deaminase-related metal-dependent hydrolase